MGIYDEGYELGAVDLKLDLDGKSVPQDVQLALEGVYFEMVEDCTALDDDPFSYLHNFSSESREALLFLLDKLRPYFATGDIAQYESEVKHYAA